MCPFCTNLIETVKHCFWTCGFMETNHKIINSKIFQNNVLWGAVLWAMVHDKPMVYEQEEVADAIVMRYGLIKKQLNHLNPQIQIDKPQI